MRSTTRPKLPWQKARKAEAQRIGGMLDGGWKVRLQRVTPPQAPVPAGWSPAKAGLRTRSATSRAQRHRAGVWAVCSTAI